MKNPLPNICVVHVLPIVVATLTSFFFIIHFWGAHGFISCSSLTKSYYRGHRIQLKISYIPTKILGVGEGGPLVPCSYSAAYLSQEQVTLSQPQSLIPFCSSTFTITSHHSVFDGCYLKLIEITAIQSDMEVHHSIFHHLMPSAFIFLCVLVYYFFIAISNVLRNSAYILF